MSFYNFLRDLFGAGGKQQPPNYAFEDQWQHRNEFRNPIWQTDEDDDDDNDDFRRPGQGNPGVGHFNVYSDPFELTRYFENQMDNMLKNFFGFTHDSITLPFGDESSDHFHRPIPIEPPPKRGNLRDDVLKPGYDTLESQNSLPSDKEKLDTDLDGRITSDDLSKIWKDPSAFQSSDSFTNTPQRCPLFSKSFGQSISTTIIRKADGTVEQRRMVRDSEGNEETTVTHQIGDKTRTVVIKKDKNGEQSETEIVDSKNPSSEKPLLSLTDEPRDSENPLSKFPWHKFFGPNPKL